MLVMTVTTEMEVMTETNEIAAMTVTTKMAVTTITNNTKAQFESPKHLQPMLKP